MSEETKDYENDGLGPCLALYHPIANYAGSALRMWLYPAIGGQDGCISLKIADRVHGHFDWAHSLYVQLKAVDLAKLIMVFQGWTESLGSDGAGDNRIRFEAEDAITDVHLTHRVEPLSGYWLDITRTARETADTPEQTAVRQITLSNAEALAISEAIRGAMSRVAFGDMRIMCGIDYGKEEA